MWVRSSVIVPARCSREDVAHSQLLVRELMASDCPQRVMWGFGVGATLGSSVGTGCSPPRACRQAARWTDGAMLRAAGAMYGTYEAFKLKVRMAKHAHRRTAGGEGGPRAACAACSTPAGIAVPVRTCSCAPGLHVFADTRAVQAAARGADDHQHRPGEHQRCCTAHRASILHARGGCLAAGASGA